MNISLTANDTIETIMDEYCMVLNPITGDILELNESSTEIWNKIKKGCKSLEEICEQLLKDYTIDAALLKSDIAEILQIFSDKKLIEIQ